MSRKESHQKEMEEFRKSQKEKEEQKAKENAAATAGGALKNQSKTSGATLFEAPGGITSAGLDPGFRLENSILDAKQKEQDYADFADTFAQNAMNEELLGNYPDSRAFWTEAAEMDQKSKEAGAKAVFFQTLSQNPGILSVRPGSAPKPPKPTDMKFRDTLPGIGGRLPSRFGDFQTAPAVLWETTPKKKESTDLSTVSGTYADREAIQLQIDQLTSEMDAYIESTGGRADVTALRWYLTRLSDLNEALDNLPTEATREDILLQALSGNYYTGRPTLGGVAGQIGLGLLGADFPTDVLNLSYDIKHRDSVPKGQFALDALALLPVLGGLKYVDEAAALVKHGDGAIAGAKTAANASTAAKQADNLVDTGGDLVYNGAKQFGKADLKPADLMDELAASGKKYTPEDVIMVTKNSNGDLLWLEQGTDSAGLNHILQRHSTNFEHCGISSEKVPQVLREILQTEPIKTSRTKQGPFSIYTYNGNDYLVAYGTNGYVVSFYPYSIK